MRDPKTLAAVVFLALCAVAVFAVRIDSIEAERRRAASSTHAMKCEPVGGSLRRCWNDEVVCYGPDYSSADMECEPRK